MKTYMAKANEVKRDCYIVDATDKILGRLATKVADVLRGKHKPTFTPHVDTGDTVIVINAKSIRVTGNKLKQKGYQRYSGYPSGQKTVMLEVMLAKKPEEVVRLAVFNMIPSGPLGRKIIKKLKIYGGEKHPHQAQNPIPLEV